MVYLLSFAVSLFFIWVSGKIKNKNKIISYCLTAVGLLIPCMLAALRSIEIGTDTDTYVVRLFNHAHGLDGSFWEFYTHRYTVVTEPLYILATYISSKLSTDVGMLFFINQALVILPIYFAIKRKSQNTNETLLGMLVYLTFFFNLSLNMARQSIALAFIVLAFSYLDDNKNIKFFIFSIIATLFHTTAVIVVGIFVVYKLLTSQKIDKRIKFAMKIILLIATLLSVVFFKQILNVLNSIEALQDIVNSGGIRKNVDINFFNTTFYTIIFGLIYFNANKLKNTVTNYEYYQFAALWAIILIQIGAVVQFSERIVHYVTFPTMFLVLPKLAPKSLRIYKSKEELVSFVVLIATLCAYWSFWILIINQHETNPYLLR